MKSGRWNFLLGGVLSLGFAAAWEPGTRMEVCHIAVQDKSGLPVTDLQQSAFTILENGVMQEIQLFRREDASVSIRLIVDNSGRMRANRIGVEAVGQALVTEVHPDDEVVVANFADKVYFDLPHGKNFTTDRAEIREALTRFDPRGSSALREAIVSG